VAEKSHSAIERASWIAGIVGALAATVALAITLAASKDDAAPSRSSAPPAAPVPRAPAPATSSVGGEVSVPQVYGRTYDEARTLLIQAGWIPAKHHWLYGDSIQVKSGNGPVFWERGYLELDACAGTGAANCRFRFIDPSGRVLVVVTEGEAAGDSSYHATVTRYSLQQPGEDNGT
jgi:hypothetical protein